MEGKAAAWNWFALKMTNGEALFVQMNRSNDLALLGEDYPQFFLCRRTTVLHKAVSESGKVEFGHKKIVYSTEPNKEQLIPTANVYMVMNIDHNVAKELDEFWGEKVVYSAKEGDLKLIKNT